MLLSFMPQVEKKLRFPVASRMSADLQTFVEAVWKLDHGFYKVGSIVLLIIDHP